MIDPILFDDLRARAPQEVLGRTRAEYDEETGQYQVRFWGQRCGVDPGAGRVGCPDLALEGPWAYAPLILVHYLLSARDIPLQGQWVSEKDLTGGSAFFRGPHTLPVRLIAERFQADVQGFGCRCREMGGQALDLADAAFEFTLLPGIPVAVLLWMGDEMFGAEARLLVDPSIGQMLPLDVIYALGVTVCQVLAAP